MNWHNEGGFQELSEHFTLRRRTFDSEMHCGTMVLSSIGLLEMTICKIIPWIVDNDLHIISNKNVLSDLIWLWPI